MYSRIAFTVLLVAAASAQLHPRPRQASSARPSSASTTSTTSSASGASGIPSGSGSSSATPNASLSNPPTFPVTIASTNPTAVPLASIVVTAPSQATVPLDSTYAAGAVPTVISGAPPLPDISAINPANYPPLDKAPPTTSPEVQAAIAQVNSSGFSIPNIPPTVAGGCPTNPAAVADTSRCWWTCNQCTRNTDIITCPDKLTWGSSFDDGPSPYTPTLVQYLDQQNLKTTFFVVGSRVISRPDYVRSQYMGGHQIAVHTWSHTPLTTQTTEEVIAEFYWSKKVIKDVLGVTPNVFRPPYGDIDDRIRAIGAAMGLTAIIWTSGSASNHVSFDTNDFNIPAGTVSASGVIMNFNNILKNATVIDSGFIVLEHDLFQQAVDLATGYILPEALAMNLTLKPIVSCLNKPLSDAYIETNNNGTNPPPVASGTAIAGGAATTLAPGSAASGTSSKSRAEVTSVSKYALAGVQVFLATALGAVAVL